MSYELRRRQQSQERGTTLKKAKLLSKPLNRQASLHPIEVFCRVRPLDTSGDLPCVQVLGDKTIVLLPNDSSNTKDIKEIHHTFQHVFSEEASQKEVFNRVALPLLQDVLRGDNGLILTYGITCSGKTYTILGTPQECGLIPRCLDVIFNSIKDQQTPKFRIKADKQNVFNICSIADALNEQQKELGLFSKTPKSKKNDLGPWACRTNDGTTVENHTNVEYAIFISYVEMHNNYIYDLFEDLSTDYKKFRRSEPKIIREDKTNNMFIFGAAEKEVKSANEALELILKAQHRRHIASTMLNAESSRSHTILSIRVVQAPTDFTEMDKEDLIVSKLCIVDLAGSERTNRTNAVGQVIREAGNINASLMALRSCIEALRDAQFNNNLNAKLIPYRDSKLTLLFKDFFEGLGKIRMIVCVNPRSADYDETIQVLKFSDVTQDVLLSRATPISGIICRYGSTPYATPRGRNRGVIQNRIATLREKFIPVVFTLGPKFPENLLMIDDSFTDSSFDELIEFVADKKTRRNNLIFELAQRNETFRQLLHDAVQENSRLKQDKELLSTDLKARETQIKQLEEKLAQMHDEMQNFAKENSELHNKAQNLKELHKEQIQNLHERIKRFENMAAQIEFNAQRQIAEQKQILNEEFAKKTKQMKKKLYSKDAKFQQVKEILSQDETDTLSSERNFSEDDISITIPKTRIVTRRRGIEKRHASDDDLVINENYCGDINKKAKTEAMTSHKSIAVANPRHRRSATDGKWIEHKPKGSLELGTVLQPKMKKKKSVSKITKSDIVKSDVTQYVLTHQEQDSKGEVETQLFKGDVIPSCSKGAQVIFTDIEKLRQESPPKADYNLRKRSSGGLTCQQVEDRCSVSVEGHSGNNKIRRK